MGKGLVVACLFFILAVSFFAAGEEYSYAGPNQEVRWEQEVSVPSYPPQNSGLGVLSGAVATSDGGFALVGWINGGTGRYADIVLVKTDANGSQQWTRIYEDPNESMAFSVAQTTDGGYIMSGTTSSTPNDLNSYELFLLKVDQYGAEEWNKTIPGVGGSPGGQIQQAPDSGYVTVGAGPLTVIKTFANGSLQWSRAYPTGGSSESATALQETSGGGCIVLAEADYQFTGGYGRGAYVLKVDGVGNMQWNRTFVSGETYIDDVLRSVQETADGGYILAGVSNSSEMVYSGRAWIVKLYSNGSTQWSSTYDESGLSSANLVRQTFDGGYIAAITSLSYLGDRVCLWKTYANGTTTWLKLLTATSYIRLLQQTSDGDYVLVGSGSVGWTGDLIKVSGSPPIPVQETVSTLYLVSLAFLGATIATILVLIARSIRRKRSVDAQLRTRTSFQVAR